MSDVDWEGMQPPVADTPSEPTQPAPPAPPAPPVPPVTSPETPLTPPPPPPPPSSYPPIGGVGVPPPPPPPLPPASMVSPPHGRGRRSGLIAVMAILLAAALAVGGFALARSTESNKANNNATSKLSNGATLNPVVDPSNSNEPIASVAAAVSPTVVQIDTTEGLGSGFIYDNNGHILTAAHVVDGAGRTVKVRLPDGSTTSGTVVGSDDATDVAVIKIESSANAQVAQLATGVKVQVGETAVAIGSPFGLTETVTAGIVSAVDRPEETPGGAVNMLQIDTPINPGNSGGPVVDLKGRVICIADQILSQSGENNGVGFCVPIDLAKQVADKLVAGQPVEFGFLGVSTDPSSSSGASDGAIVTSVSQGSAAAQAGLEEGDKITAVDNEPVHDPIELGAKVRSHQPGDTVTLTVSRGGQQQSIQVTLGSTKSK